MHIAISINKLAALVPYLVVLAIATGAQESRAAPPDCIGSSLTGTRVCVSPVVKPWSYGLCDGFAPYQYIDAQWCQAINGTWVGYYAGTGPCQNGSPADPYNEAAVMAVGDRFMQIHSNATPTGDTAWGSQPPPSYYCWNTTPLYTTHVPPIEYYNARLRNYTNANGPGSLHVNRQREVVCPNGSSSRQDAQGRQYCEPNQEYPQCPAGNPITPGTGRKIQIEQDEVFEGRPVRRYYKSTTNLELWIDQPTTEAKFWADEFDLKLVVDPNGFILGGTSSPDGFVQIYKLDGSPMLSTGSTSTRLVKSGVNYFLYQQDSLIQFGPDGRMLNSTTADGKQLSFAYADGTTGLNGATATDSGATPVAVPAGTLLTVNSWTGRSIQYQRRKSGVASGMVVQPLGTAITYEFGSGELVSKVNYPDATARTYHYGESAFREALTGISRHDSLGNVVRAGTYRYDGNGKAISTEAAGATNKFDLSWTAQSETVVDTTVLSPLGTASQVRYSKISNVWKPVWSSQAAGAGCSASTQATSYDVNGNVESETDFNGNRVCKAHDLTRNLESVRVEGLAGTATCSAVTGSGATVPSGARKISTQWHPDWRLETRRADPKKITTFVYNGQPDPTNGNAVASCAPGAALLPDGKPIVVLCKTVEQATTDADGSQGFAAAATGPARITSATYNQRGQVLTRTDPRNFTTTYAYYATTTADSMPGDLQSITNPAGHVTQYTRFDKAGRVLRMVEANGIATDTTYNPRGWVTAVTVTPSTGTPQTTTYTHTETGKLSTVTLPDGTTMSYAYDASQRLTGVTDGSGNSVTYTLDNAGNRTSEQHKDPGGALARNITRVFDALGRLQVVTGAPQ